MKDKALTQEKKIGKRKQRWQEILHDEKKKKK